MLKCDANDENAVTLEDGDDQHHQLQQQDDDDDEAKRTEMMTDKQERFPLLLLPRCEWWKWGGRKLIKILLSSNGPCRAPSRWTEGILANFWRRLVSRIICHSI